MARPTQGHIELNWMTTLATVAQVGSFTIAAERLHLTQSAVSQQVASLERWAGASLLRRRPVELTPAGQLVVSRHSLLFAHIAALSLDLAQLRDGYQGSVHIAGFLSACRTFVSRAFEAFGRDRPDVVLRLSQMEPGPALAALQHGGVDIAIVFSYGSLEVQPMLESVLVCDEAVVLAVPADHPLATRDEVSMNDIDMNSLVPASDAFVFPPAPDEGGFRYIGDDFSVVLALVAAGRGIALVPGLAAMPAPPGTVLRPLVGDGLPRRRISAVTVRGTENRAASKLVGELRRFGFAAADAQLQADR